MVASDGGINTSHPRGAGTFPRVLGRFVRDEQWLSLPEAIRKMTSMPAARLKLADRGTIAVGMKADLVLFDPATMVDRSTFEQPRLRARGIYRVFVNGEPVWTGTRPRRTSGRRADRALKRPLLFPADGDAGAARQSQGIGHVVRPDIDGAETM